MPSGHSFGLFMSVVSDVALNTEAAADTTEQWTIVCINGRAALSLQTVSRAADKFR